ncbi:transcriptional regulator [Phyllobacterium salinisoli]|uniref:Transcriptional regulator n=1 Tax=Phyllobacterium salinisoli TaxID=1899321 RepID=A0A368K5W9_9HYPH|nr:metalloregulator ArsR/SmtB family transcription factor [Phyllobacterium salinisoli]RCS23863.1 transcriptional regulator [Phyllobacterium salinisoli]
MNREEILKALAHPIRLDMLNWMKEPENHFTQEHPFEMGVCAGGFERSSGLSQSAVSAHLATLSRAELVTTRRVGQWIFYKRNEETIAAFLKSLSDL